MQLMQQNVQKSSSTNRPRNSANESGADALGKEQVKDEAKLKPKAGAKVKVGDKELVWKEHGCKEHLLDFNAIH